MATAPFGEIASGTSMDACPTVPHRVTNVDTSVEPFSISAEDLTNKRDQAADQPSAHRNWDCVLCGKSGNGVKGSRPVKPNGRIHDGCRRQDARGIVIDRVERKRPAVSESFASGTPTHKIAKADSNLVIAPTFDIESTCAAPAVIQATETYNVRVARVQQLRQFAFARVPATEESRNLAWRLLQLDKDAEGQKIAGGVTQVTPSSLGEFSTDGLRVEMERLVRQTAKEIDVPEVDKKFVVDNKILIAPPKRGKQFPHWDRERTAKSLSMYTFLLCCTNGCYSTALPTYAYDARLASSTKKSEMEEVAHLIRDVPENFRSMPMNVGDIIVFQHTLPHYGVANTMPSGNRVMFFCVLSDTPEWGQDEQQVPAWLFVGEAFGWSSEEFAKSLVENRRHDPLIRIESDYGAKNLQLAIICLEKFGLTKKYKSRSTA